MPRLAWGNVKTEQRAHDWALLGSGESHQGLIYVGNAPGLVWQEQLVRKILMHASYGVWADLSGEQPVTFRSSVSTQAPMPGAQHQGYNHWSPGGRVNP
jgi:hypothetical protein